MGKNLELKIKVDEHRSFVKILESINANYNGVLNQKDIYYKTEDYLLKLRIQNDRNELIKYNRDEVKPERWSDYEIINLTGDNPEEFFSSILQVEAEVIKKRVLYLYNNTRIHLDEVERLGSFLELETVVTNDLTDAKKRFNELVEILNLDISKQIKNSYRDLILEL